MKRLGRRRVFAGLIAVLIASAALGQAPMTPPPASKSAGPASEVQGSYARVKANVIKAAEKMPAEDYGFKPTQDVRAFAGVVDHVIEAQMRVCGTVNHKASGEAMKMPAEAADKAAIVVALKASFAECDKAYAAATDANLAEVFELGLTKRSRVGLLWGNVSHDNEQYATLALYMRLKGLVPPSSEK